MCGPSSCARTRCACSTSREQTRIRRGESRGRRGHRGRLPKSREDMFEFYEFIRKGSHDSATKQGDLEFPAGYMFKNVPQWDAGDMADPVEMLFLEHQRHGINQAIV